MSYGTYLRQKRVGKMSQKQLAQESTKRGKAVTDAYISNIERGYDKNKKGNPIRPDEDYVVVWAEILGCDVDEALIQANYAPRSTKNRRKPESLAELVTILVDYGVVDLQMFGGEKVFENFTADDYEDFLERIINDLKSGVKRKNREAIGAKR